MGLHDVSAPVRDFLDVSNSLIEALKQRRALNRHERLLLRTYLKGLETSLSDYECSEWQNELRLNPPNVDSCSG